MATQDWVNNNPHRMRSNPVSKDKSNHRQHSHYRGCTTREMNGKITGRAIILLSAQVMMVLGKRDQLQTEQYSQEKIQHAAQA